MLLNFMYLESPALTFVLLLLSVALGMLAGEVVYAAAWRMAHDSGGAGLQSCCPHCGHELSRVETIPVVSWVVQRGRCRHCGHAIGWAYPTVELLSGGIFASVVLRFGMSLQTIEVLGAACVLLCMALSTLWDYRVPNVCVAAAVVVRCAYLGALAVAGEGGVDLVKASLFGSLALGLPLLAALLLTSALLARDPIGLGTVKVVGVVGLYLGWQQGLFALAIAVAFALFAWLISPSKLLEVEVAGGAHRQDVGAGSAVLHNRAPENEEDIAEPLRLPPLVPSLALGCWIMLLVGVAPAVWSSPLF